MTQRPTKGDLSELKILNTVAWCLSSCDGSAVAACLERTLPLTFLLAMSGSVTAEDREDAAWFFEVLQAASCWGDILPYVVSRGSKRINKTLRSLSTYPIHTVLQRLDSYLPGPSLAGEYRAIDIPEVTRKSQSTDSRLIFHMLVMDLNHSCAEFLSVHADSNDDIAPKVASLTSLLALATKIIASRPLRYCDQFPDGHMYKQQLVDLIVRYIHRLHKLIQYRDRFVRTGCGINYVWLDDLPPNLYQSPTQSGSSNSTRGPFEGSTSRLDFLFGEGSLDEDHFKDFRADSIYSDAHPQLRLVLHLHANAAATDTQIIVGASEPP